MNTLETICSRKSIRNYTGESISESDLQLILKAANASPVGMGQYDSVFLTVISNPNLLGKIDKACADFMHRPDSHPLYGAPTLIIVSSKIAAHMENPAYSNAAIIAHNMALEATELGIGTCYIWGAVAAINTTPELVKELNLPDNFVPCCGVILGKTSESYPLREISSDKIAMNKLN
jgi:nitroreductase